MRMRVSLRPMVWSFILSVGLLAQAASAQAVTCTAIAPTTSPATNQANIQGCLNALSHLAVLQTGTFSLSDGVTVPSNGQLKTANGATPASLRLSASGAHPNFVVALGGSSGSVSSVNVYADGNASSANGSVLNFNGSNNTVSNVTLADSSPSGSGLTGVYFICAGCSGNVVTNANIGQVGFGVIFRQDSGQSSPNRIVSSQIHDVGCDGVSVGGYGAVLNTTITRTGRYCGNGLPGAGIYSLKNSTGMDIEGNTISNTCGNGLDFDKVRAVTAKSNTISNPGYRISSGDSYCGTAVAANLINISNSLFDHNVFLNGVPTAAINCHCGHNQWLPGYQGQPIVVAVVLGWDDEAPEFSTWSWATTHNTLTFNQWRSSCRFSSTPNCWGIGIYTSQYTGVAYGQWSASTTNGFTDNQAAGSDSGSERPGGNWWAADYTCTESSHPSPCNDDDWQHNYPNGDWERSKIM